MVVWVHGFVRYCNMLAILTASPQTVGNLGAGPGSNEVVQRRSRDKLYWLLLVTDCIGLATLTILVPGQGWKRPGAP